MILKHALALATALLLATPTLTSTAYAASLVSGSKLKQLLNGKTTRFQSGSRAIYNADGTYRFRGGGNNSRGQWSVTGSKVCVTFTNGFRRCDQYLKDGDSYVLRDANGNEYPVRSIK